METPGNKRALPALERLEESKDYLHAAQRAAAELGKTALFRPDTDDNTTHLLCPELLTHVISDNLLALEEMLYSVEVHLNELL